MGLAFTHVCYYFLALKKIVAQTGSIMAPSEWVDLFIHPFNLWQDTLALGTWKYELLFEDNSF